MSEEQLKKAWNEGYSVQEAIVAKGKKIYQHGTNLHIMNSALISKNSKKFSNVFMNLCMQYNVPIPESLFTILDEEEGWKRLAQALLMGLMGEGRQP